MSSLRETLKADLTTAMKARDEATVSTLRMVIAAVMNAEVAGDEAVVLSDDQVMAVLLAEGKKRTEAAQFMPTMVVTKPPKKSAQSTPSLSVIFQPL